MASRLPRSKPQLPAPAESARRARRYQRESRSENTRRAYGYALEAFAAWGEQQGFDEDQLLPASPELVASFLADEASAGLAPKTIGLRASAIAYTHKKARMTNPCASVEVEETLRGIRRRAARRRKPTQAAALTPEILAACMTTLDRKSRIGKRDALLLTLGMAAGTRRSELVAFDVEDVQDDGQGLAVTFTTSKTDPEGAGAEVYIPRARDKAICALRAYRDWIKASGVTAGALLRAVGKGGHIGSRLSDRDVDRIVRRVTEGAGQEGRFSGHSLRAGLVTGLAERGRTEIEIMQQSRHKSSAMIRLYARSVDAKASTPLRGAW